MDVNWNEMHALRGLKPNDPMSVSYALETVDTEEGRARVADVLASRPFPHFEVDTTDPTVLIRISADGTRTRGRYVGRVFQAIE